MEKNKELKFIVGDYYKCERGDITQCLFVSKIERYKKSLFIIIDFFESEFWVNSLGEICEDDKSEGFNDGYNIIEHIGPELPKEPRKFEFEGYIENNSIKCLRGILLTHPGLKNKWKVTMEEIIE